MEFLTQLEPWHWLSLGLLVLILEALGTGGFLLGIGIASLLVSVLLMLFPALPWYTQSVLFALLSVVISLVYWKRFRNFNHRTDQPLLNSRTERLIGRSATLVVAVRNGTGKVQIEDALWTVSCVSDLEVGTVVNIIGADGMTLLVQEREAP